MKLASPTYFPFHPLFGREEIPYCQSDESHPSHWLVLTQCDSYQENLPSATIAEAGLVH